MFDMVFDMSVTDTPNLGQPYEAALVLLIGKKLEGNLEPLTERRASVSVYVFWGLLLSSIRQRDAMTPQFWMEEERKQLPTSYNIVCYRMKIIYCILYFKNRPWSSQALSKEFTSSERFLAYFLVATDILSEIQRWLHILGF